MQRYKLFQNCAIDCAIFCKICAMECAFCCVWRLQRMGMLLKIIIALLPSKKSAFSRFFLFSRRICLFTTKFVVGFSLFLPQKWLKKWHFWHPQKILYDNSKFLLVKIIWYNIITKFHISIIGKNRRFSPQNASRDRVLNFKIVLNRDKIF